MPPQKKKTKKKTATDQSVSPGKYLISTRPVLKSCGRCGAFVGQGHAEGRKLQLDFVPLSESQCVLAALAGITLCLVDAHGLVEITSWRKSLPGMRFPQHRCGVKWRQEADAVIDPRFTIQPIPDLPPF